MDAAAPSVGSNVDAYGVDSELDGVKLMVEKNTGFALPMKATDPKAGPCDRKVPCEKELSPTERKIREVEDQVATLAKAGRQRQKHYKTASEGARKDRRGS